MAYTEEQAHTFMAHQRTIDTLICLPYTSHSRAEMINQFRRMYADVPSTLAEINYFDRNYTCNTALQWYQRDSFLFRTIDQTLRLSSVELMFQLRYFLTDLYLQLFQLHRQTRNRHQYYPCNKFYRGQIMSTKEFRSFQQLQGHVISINTFFFTKTSLQAALSSTNTFFYGENYLPVIFCIIIDPYVTNERPYANISHFSSSRGDDEEVLFSMGSIFSIEQIEYVGHNNHRIPMIHLETIDPMTIDGGPAPSNDSIQ